MQVLETDPSLIPSAASSQELTEKTFRWMLLARLLDDKFASLYRGGKIHGGVFLGRGQEALSASLGVHLRKGDVFAPLIRDLAGRLAFGEQIIDGVRTYLGSPQGPMRARDGNVHRGRPREGLLPMISHLGSMISVVSGVLFARKLKGLTGSVGATCIGDGGTSTGSFHEGLNFAAVERLPLVLVVANNQYAYSTPTSRQFVCDDLILKAQGYGVESHSVNGTQLDDCLATLGTAVERARSGNGPQLVVASLLRLAGHGEHDDAHYVAPSLKNSPIGRDCLDVAREDLLTKGWGTTASMEAMRTDLLKQIDDAVATAQREAGPDPFQEDWCPLATRHLMEGLEGLEANA